MNRRIVGFFAILTCLIQVAYCACPNKCSGHGHCGANDVCACEPNWIYGDCSGRVCSYQRAWIDTPLASNDAHNYAECSNRGTCDRSTGECVCDDGYTGRGCRRTTCFQDCNGHGTCNYIEEFSSTSYDFWDREKIMGCMCDGGWTGSGCQNRICPNGDDPLTTTGSNMYQYIIFTGIDLIPFYISYTDSYGFTYNTEKMITGTLASADQTLCDTIQQNLRALPNRVLDTVTVVNLASFQQITRSTTDPLVSYTTGVWASTATFSDSSSALSCVVKFPSTPGATGIQKLLTVVTSTSLSHGKPGHQPLIADMPAGGAVVVGEAALTSDTSRILTELSVCSNRGLCDPTTGTCTCFSGSKGIACEGQEALV